MAHGNKTPRQPCVITSTHPHIHASPGHPKPQTAHKHTHPKHPRAPIHPHAPIHPPSLSLITLLLMNPPSQRQVRQRSQVAGSPAARATAQELHGGGWGRRGSAACRYRGRCEACSRPAGAQAQQGSGTQHARSMPHKAMPAHPSPSHPRSAPFCQPWPPACLWSAVSSRVWRSRPCFCRWKAKLRSMSSVRSMAAGGGGGGGGGQMAKRAGRWAGGRVGSSEGFPRVPQADRAHSRRHRHRLASMLAVPGLPPHLRGTLA